MAHNIVINKTHVEALLVLTLLVAEQLMVHYLHLCHKKARIEHAILVAKPIVTLNSRRKKAPEIRDDPGEIIKHRKLSISQTAIAIAMMMISLWRIIRSWR